MKRTLKLFIAALAAVTVVSLAGCTPLVWEGSDAGRAVFRAGSNVSLEDEKYVLNVTDLPTRDMNGEQIASYKSRMSASYVFGNCGDAEETVEIYYPAAERPEYFTGSDSVADPVFEVNEVKTEATVRHFYDGHGDAQSTFFTEETPVTIYSYQISAPDSSGRQTFTATDLLSDGETTRFLVSSYATYSGGELTVRAAHGEQFTVYVFGEAPEKLIWRGANAGTTVLCYTKYTTFGTLLEELRPEQISKEDWFTGTVAMLEDKTDDSGLISSYSVVPSLSQFDCYFSCTVTVPAGGRTQCVVTAPLLPTLYEDGDCTYMLVPARFSNGEGSALLKVEVKTPFAMQQSDFRKTENGYYYEGMRSNYFSFTLWDKAAEEAKEAEAAAEAARFDAKIRTVTGITAYIIIVVLTTGITLAIALPISMNSNKKGKK